MLQGKQGNVNLGMRDGFWSEDYEKSAERGFFLLPIQKMQGTTTHYQGPRARKQKTETRNENPETPRYGQTPSPTENVVVLRRKKLLMNNNIKCRAKYSRVLKNFKLS